MLGLRAPKTVLPLSDYQTADYHERRFSPYSHNHGSVVAIAGKDFVVIASDTRLSSGYTILTRDQSKLFPLSSTAVLGSTGCWCDVLTFAKVVEARKKIYANTHNEEMTTQAFGKMVSTMLYAKRFFPYYISNLVAGLDENGEGVVYNYDPVGSQERCDYRAVGSSVSLLQPMLDNQVGKKNMPREDQNSKPTLEEAINLVHDCFISATEREIHTGDAIAFKIITKNGIEEKTVALRRD